MGSEAPCYGGGLSGICLPIIHFKFYFSITLANPIFSNFSKILNIPPNFYTLKTFEKSSKNSQTIIELGTPNLIIKSFFDWMKSWLDIWRKNTVMLLIRRPP